MTPNSQNLIDLPGYGNAQKELIKAGLWDDARVDVDGDTDMEFTVKITGTYHPQAEEQVFKVIAKTKDEALDEAEEMSDFDEIEDVEITSIKEATE